MVISEDPRRNVSSSKRSNQDELSDGICSRSLRYGLSYCNVSRRDGWTRSDELPFQSRSKRLVILIFTDPYYLLISYSGQLHIDFVRLFVSREYLIPGGCSL